MQPFGFVGEHYKDYSLSVGVEETRNLYPAIVASPTARKRIVLQNVPGLALVRDTAETIRDMLSQDGQLFVVAGTKLYELDSAWNATLRNPALPMANDGARAKIVSSGRQGHQLVINAGNLGYVYDTVSNAFSKITDAAFPASCRTVEYIGNFFAALDTVTGQVTLSTLLDGTAFDGLAVAIRSLTSDKVIHLAALGEDLWFFGTKTITPWRNTGAGAFPFIPVPGATIVRGLRNPATVVRMAGGFVFLGDGENGGTSIYRTQGYSAIQISTPAVEYRLGTGVYDAEAYGYEEDGNVFYVLELPSLHTCMVYNFTTSLWHEINEWDTRTGVWEAHRGRCHAWAFDQHIIGDRAGKIYRQSLDLYDFAGSPRRCLRRAPHIGDGSAALFHDAIYFDLEVGVGLTTGQGSDPQMMLRYSDNYGKTWSNERWAPIGEKGDYRARVFFYRLGMTRGARVYEASVSDPVKIVIADAMLDARPGA